MKGFQFTFYATLALTAFAAPAAAQDGGVACVIGNVAPERLLELSEQNYAETISVAAIADELKPHIRACMDKGVMAHQAQVDASFTFAMGVLQVYASGNELQAAGVDPDGIERLLDTMPSELRAQLMANAKDSANPLPESELIAYVSANSGADEAQLLGTALYFLLGVATTRVAEQEFAAAQ